MKNPTIYLCHNCSSIQSPSGEACIIIAEENSNILHGNHKCMRGYTLPTTEEQRRECPLILPDELDFETDFYVVGSDEARENLEKVESSPLWEVLKKYEYTEEEYLVEHPEHRSLFERLGYGSLKGKMKILEKYGGNVPKSAFRQLDDMYREREIEYFMSGRVCRLDEDPLIKSH